jgi:hypothetical protein
VQSAKAADQVVGLQQMVVLVFFLMPVMPAARLRTFRDLKVVTETF